jgi:hypothetical protein
MFDFIIIIALVYKWWFLGGVGVGLVIHFDGILKEARQERMEEAKFKEIKQVNSVVVASKEIKKY